MKKYSPARTLIQQKKQKQEQQLRKLEENILSLSEEEGEKYIAYRTGKLRQEEYVHYRLWKDERLGELEKQKSQYQEEIKTLDRKEDTYLKAIRSLVKLKRGEDLTKEMVEALIEKIYVYPGKHVEIVFVYSDIHMGGVE